MPLRFPLIGNEKDFAAFSQFPLHDLQRILGRHQDNGKYSGESDRRAAGRER